MFCYVCFSLLLTLVPIGLCLSLHDVRRVKKITWSLVTITSSSFTYFCVFVIDKVAASWFIFT
jgi:hypothetical protein